ncbi:MAG TPA: hypothetical protein VMG35_01315 [Bryobacteraceae bacterium]|nr:hypothetical protein [Bryobacteraceae bacterium]
MEPEELSRRIWLLRLGSGALLAGWSGEDLAADRAKLPPGLYAPSADHLAHVLRPASHDTQPAAPLFFDAAEYSRLQDLVARMLGEEPATPPVPEITAWIDLVVHDAAEVRRQARALSPANHALAVGFYGEEAVRELETTDAQELCRAGLARLKAEPHISLETLESQRDAFILWLKRRVIEGFYTSEAGLKELNYKGNSFYSVCPGCGGRS